MTLPRLGSQGFITSVIFVFLEEVGSLIISVFVSVLPTLFPLFLPSLPLNSEHITLVYQVFLVGKFVVVIVIRLDRLLFMFNCISVLCSKVSFPDEDGLVIASYGDEMSILS